MASDYKTGVPKEASEDPTISPYGHSIAKQTRYILKNFSEPSAAAGVASPPAHSIAVLKV